LSRDRAFALAAATVVVLTLAVGFFATGSPGEQRARQADRQRASDLRQIAYEINAFYLRKPDGQRALPSSLAELQAQASGRSLPINDPLTEKPYRYELKSGPEYRLCADFERPSVETQGRRSSNRPSFWRHPLGAHCFEFRAPEQPPYE
jgi:hypothetical protein